MAHLCMFQQILDFVHHCISTNDLSTTFFCNKEIIKEIVKSREINPVECENQWKLRD